MQMRIWGVRFSVIIFAVLLLLLAARPAFSGFYDPKLKYRTIDTKHFSIHYPEYIEDVAQKAAVISEDIFETLSPKFEWVPWGKTQMVLTDESDSANGMATVLPYNWMFIRVTAAGPNDSLGYYEDWLRLLIMHEYTHILHLDKYKGAWTPLRYVLGKLVAPNGMSPGWIKEGLAVFEETAETMGGRGRATYSDMIMRTAVLQDEFLPIDMANGDMWEWPGMNARYIYGIKFLEYLADMYGEDKLYEFVDRMSGSMILGGINRQARWSFSDIEFETYKVGNRYAKEKKPGAPRSKTFYKLWDEWHEYLKKEYNAQLEELKKEGITPVDTVISSKKAYFANPAVSPDGTRIAYSEYSPYGPPRLMIADIDGKNRKRLVKNTYASQISFSGDGSFIVYSKTAKYKKYQFIYDLYKYDFETKKVKRLTSGKRANDPDVSPDGKEVVCVTQNAGTSRLELYNIEKKELIPVENNFPEFTQFANPRFSPDGSKIAVSIAVPGSIWDVYIFDRNGKEFARVTDNLAIDDDPVWAPDGQALYFISDKSGITNIYKHKLGGKKSERITNVITGISTPSIAPDGISFFVKYYNGNGYDIRKITMHGGSFKQEGYKPEVLDYKFKEDSFSFWQTEEERRHTELAEGSKFLRPELYESRKYSAFGRSFLLPRFITPYMELLDDAFFFSFLTGAADPLRWNNWMGGVTYRTDSKHIGYFFKYWYNRFKPVFTAGMMNYSVEYGYLTFVNSATGARRTVHLFEKRIRGYGGFAYPLENHIFSVNYFYENRESSTPLSQAEKDAINLGAYAGFIFYYGYNDSKQYAASISRQGGRIIKTNFSVNNSIFGCGEKNEQYIFAGDWREYIKTFGRQVLAFRVAGGMTWGDELVQGTFSMGGSLGEGMLAGGGSLYYFPLRGLPVATFSRDRAMLFSGEYRFPLINAQRGLGTLPLFLNDIHVAFFADYGNAWDAVERMPGQFFNDFMLGVGAELRADFVVGYGLPLTGRLGYGIIVVNRDRLGTLTDPILNHPAREGMIIIQLGTSF